MINCNNRVKYRVKYITYKSDMIIYFLGKLVYST